MRILKDIEERLELHYLIPLIGLQSIEVHLHATDEMIQAYLEHHRNPSNADYDTIILE